MKKQVLLFIGTFVLTGSVYSQANWTKGGNNVLGGINPTIGTNGFWNSRFITMTFGVNRTQVNPIVAYPINGLAGVRDGFFLLTNRPTATAFPGGVPTLLMNNPAYGPYSLLHLVGDDSPNVQDGGYRNWMRNGIVWTNNFDMGFVGVRAMPDPIATTGTDDVSDFVINWSDNIGTGVGDRSPDNLVFCFTAGNGIGSDLVGTSLFGRETMRHTSAGQIGIGPRFSNVFQPQSTLHQHQENDLSSWHQITNQYLAAAGGPVFAGPTNVTAADGLRLGVFGNANALQNGIHLLNKQPLRSA